MKANVVGTPKCNIYWSNTSSSELRTLVLFAHVTKQFILKFCWHNVSKKQEDRAYLWVFTFPQPSMYACTVLRAFNPLLPLRVSLLVPQRLATLYTRIVYLHLLLLLLGYCQYHLRCQSLTFCKVFQQ